MQRTVGRQRQIENAGIDAVDAAQGVVEEVGGSRDGVRHTACRQLRLDDGLAFKMRHTGVLRCSGDRTEHQVWHLLVQGRADNGTTLGHFRIDPRFERSGHGEDSCDTCHRRCKRGTVVE